RSVSPSRILRHGTRAPESHRGCRVARHELKLNRNAVSHRRNLMRSLRISLVLVPLIALLVQTLMPTRAATLPLFARKYSMPCTQCHLAFPRLNAFGMKFRQDGYRLGRAKGESPWESVSFPLSLVGNVGYAFTSTDTADVVTGTRGRK